MIANLRRGVAKIATGTAVGQGAVLAVSPLLTRLYDPADFGVVSLYAAAISVLIVVGSLKFDTAIPLPEDEGTAKALVVLSLAVSVGLSLLLLVVFALWADMLLAPIGPALVPYAYLVVAGVLLGCGYQVLSYWAVRRRDYSGIAKTKASQGIGAASTQLLLGLVSGPIGLLAGDLVGRSAGIVLLYRRSGLTVANFKEREPIGSVARSYRKFPTFSAPAGLLNSVGLNIPAVLIALYWGVAAAGAYAIVQRVFGAPMALLGRSVVQVYYGEASACASTDPGSLPRLFDAVVLQLAMVAIPIGVVALLAPFGFTVIFGHEWALAGEVARALGVMFALQLIVVPISQTLQIVERQGYQLFWDAVRLLVVLLVFWASNQLSYSFVSTMYAFSLSMCVCYMALLLICRFFVIKVARVSR